MHLGRSDIVIHCSRNTYLDLCLVSFSQCVISEGLFFLPDSPFITEREYREGPVWAATCAQMADLMNWILLLLGV